MKRNLRKYSALFILLVLLTNVSFSVTLSYCSMDMKSAPCKCGTAGSEESTSFLKVPCCFTETVNISNKAEFDNNSNTRDNISCVKYFLNYETTDISEFTRTAENCVRFIFYSTTTDIPVLNSSLLI